MQFGVTHNEYPLDTWFAKPIKVKQKQSVFRILLQYNEFLLGTTLGNDIFATFFF